MSTHAEGRQVPQQLGYLLKHAHLHLTELTTAALAPYGIDGREWAVLRILDGDEPLSQQQAASRLGIDRTTMVALIDALEGKKLVERHPHADDRRKNVVELTSAGQDTLRAATQAGNDAARRFVAPLTEHDAQRFEDILLALVAGDQTSR